MYPKAAILLGDTVVAAESRGDGGRVRVGNRLDPQTRTPGVEDQQVLTSAPDQRAARAGRRCSR